MKRKQVTANHFIGHISKRAYLYYPSDCDTAIPEHVCNPCETQEHARIRGVAFIKKTFAFTDPTNAEEWKAGIASKDIVIIPETHGEFDGGTIKEGPGYGNNVSTYLSTDFTAKFFDPNYNSNYDFYNLVKRVRNYTFNYCTETKVHLTNVGALIVGKDPVVDDLTGVVEWQVDVKWTEKDSPKPYNIPEGIFECFIVE